MFQLRQVPRLHIKWGCLAHILEKEPRKLEYRTEASIFVGYPVGTKGGLFYSPRDQTVKIFMNATFLEEDYMRDFKPRSKVILEELAKDGVRSQVSNLDSDPRPKPTNNQPTTEVQRSGRTSRLPRFHMYES